MLIPVGGVELPFAFRPDVGGRFQPALGRDDIVPAIAVQIPRANAVPITFGANDVLSPFPSR